MQHRLRLTGGCTSTFVVSSRVDRLIRNGCPPPPQTSAGGGQAATTAAPELRAGARATDAAPERRKGAAHRARAAQDPPERQEDGPLPTSRRRRPTDKAAPRYCNGTTKLPRARRRTSIGAGHVMDAHRPLTSGPTVAIRSVYLGCKHGVRVATMPDGSPLVASIDNMQELSESCEAEFGIGRRTREVTHRLHVALGRGEDRGPMFPGRRVPP